MGGQVWGNSPGIGSWVIRLVQGFPCAHGGDLVLFLELLVPLLQPRAQLQVVAVSGLQVIHHAVLGPELLPTHLKITGMTCIKITGVRGIKLIDTTFIKITGIT